MAILNVMNMSITKYSNECLTKNCHCKPAPSGRGYCQKCYLNMLSDGVLKKKMYHGTPAIDRVMDNIEIVGECVLWQRGCDGHGYATIEQGHAQRVVYEYAYGFIPEGAHISMSCGNRRCMNISHMLVKIYKTRENEDGRN